MKLNELYAKRETLIKAADDFDDKTSIEDINAKKQELKKVNAQIALEEEKEETAKATAAGKIANKKMSAAKEFDKENVEDPRASEAYGSAFYSAIRGASLSQEQKSALKEAGVKGNIYNIISTSGVPVPTSFQNKLIIALENENVMRSLATVIQTESDKDIPVVATKGSADWTAENAGYNESDDTFGTVTLEAFKLTRILKVSEEILEDNTFNLEDYLVQSFARAIAVPEEAAMVIGDGSDKPTGVIVGAVVGVTASSTAAIIADNIIDLYYSLKRVYREKAVWLLADSTIKAIRKLKDSNNDYLWAKGLVGEPDTLLGRPIKSSDNVPAIAAAAKVAAFGDMSYYNIADRSKRNFQRLNELYAANGQVGFRGYERVDGKLTLAEAVKVLKMAAS